jgi:hypothetical protein
MMDLVPLLMGATPAATPPAATSPSATTRLLLRLGVVGMHIHTLPTLGLLLLLLWGPKAALLPAASPVEALPKGVAAKAVSKGVAVLLLRLVPLVIMGVVTESATAPAAPATPAPTAPAWAIRELLLLLAFLPIVLLWDVAMLLELPPAGPPVSRTWLLISRLSKATDIRCNRGKVAPVVAAPGPELLPEPPTPATPAAKSVTVITKPASPPTPPTPPTPAVVPVVVVLLLPQPTERSINLRVTAEAICCVLLLSRLHVWLLLKPVPAAASPTPPTAPPGISECRTHCRQLITLVRMRTQLLLNGDVAVLFLSCWLAAALDCGPAIHPCLRCGCCLGSRRSSSLCGQALLPLTHELLCQLISIQLQVLELLVGLRLPALVDRGSNGSSVLGRAHFLLCLRLIRGTCLRPQQPQRCVVPRGSRLTPMPVGAGGRGRGGGQAAAAAACRARHVTSAAACQAGLQQWPQYLHVLSSLPGGPRQQGGWAQVALLWHKVDDQHADVITQALLLDCCCADLLGCRLCVVVAHLWGSGTAAGSPGTS